MKAAVISGHGSPDVISIQDVPQPQPAVGEVVVRLAAASLNHLDVWVRKGGRAPLQFPHVLGSDGCGTIAAVGHGVHGWDVGADVIVAPGLWCGRCAACQGGEQSLCEQFGIVGMARPGTFAQYVAVPAQNVLPRPVHMTAEEAACLGVAYLTAWRMLFARGRLTPGETVLVHGIGGGVAIAALQLAKLAGAFVMVTSSSEDKLRKAHALGADVMFNYKTVPDLADAVLGAADSRGVDLVIDSIGAATVDLDLKVLRKGGRAVLCGVTTGAEATINLRNLYWNQIELLGSTWGSMADFRQMLAAMAVARLKPVIDAVFPLAEARQATERMERGEQFGKIVLRV